MNFKSVLTLCRVSNLPTVWMNVITAAVLVGVDQPPISWLMIAILCVALSAFYCAGMALNDLCDYHWDKQHQTYRPIVAGKLSLSQARGITVSLFSFGFLLLLVTPRVQSLVFGLLLLLVIYAYNRFHKQQAGAVLLMGAARALVFIVTAKALTEELHQWIIIAAILQFSYTLLLTIVARFEHVRGKPYAGPVIPRMIAAMPLVDSILLAGVVGPLWLILGGAMAVLTRLGQRYVRGD